MHRVLAEAPTGPGYLDLSFRDTSRWVLPEELRNSSRKGTTPIAATAALLGDDEHGPLVLMLALEPNVRPEDAPAHTHASDNWRMSLLGNLPMGRESYNPGQFRLQQGWKSYPTDNYANGPDGGWTILVFGDRRGTRLRPVRAEVPTPDRTDVMLAGWLGIDGDLVTDDPSKDLGPSSLETNLGPLRAGHVNGSFDDTSSWAESIDGTRLAVGVLSDRTHGTVVAHCASPPAVPAAPNCNFPCDVLRVVVRGSAVIGDDELQPGDMRLHIAGSSAGPVEAGASGLDQVLIIADRAALPVPDERDSYMGALAGLVADLVDEPPFLIA